ncbi:MAG: nuclear transport factor 2 family protein [Alphaproteobacteria bacterium]
MNARGAWAFAAAVLCASVGGAFAEQRPKSGELFGKIAALDAGLFAAYNACDLPRLATYFSEDLEFYHDQTGLSRGRDGFIQAIKENVCGKVRRELVAGSIEVYPLKSFGAVETGLHTFCHTGPGGACDGPAGPAKFVHVWQNTDGVWRITRVVSYDHH